MSHEAGLRELREAWRWREESGILRELEAVRIFHGPGEGSAELSSVAIDRFGSHYWITEWEGRSASTDISRVFPAIIEFLQEKSAISAVILLRPEKGIPGEPKVLFGSPPEGRFEASEDGARYRIQLLGARHPGLFLDHLPLRQWLRQKANGLKVLNTFSYTGSLSVSAGLGGAAQVTTLDLSNPILAWARENWALNGLDETRARFVSGDYFEWLPRLKREGARFDCVILDPPSFSRGKKGTFSTAKDLGKLHALALDVLAPGGYLVSSINSANVSSDRFEAEVSEAAHEKGREFQLVRRIGLPETFKTKPGLPEQRYLKGVILQERAR